MRASFLSARSAYLCVRGVGVRARCFPTPPRPFPKLVAAPQTPLIPCGVWEAVYIIEGLLKNASEVKPTTCKRSPRASPCLCSPLPTCSAST
jgi:hypothetical protein